MIGPMICAVRQAPHARAGSLHQENNPVRHHNPIQPDSMAFITASARLRAPSLV
ncbi:MAG: hypothetical protein GMKNLPBB_01475 [Myxococcota bacterium]|nr:hypothetical protein [Myxococcota bacterium]